MSVNKFSNNLYKDIFSLNSLYEIVRNIFTVMVIGISLYIFLEIYSITSEYLLLFLLASIGVLSYFCFPIVSRILMVIIEVIANFKIFEKYLYPHNEHVIGERVFVKESQFQRSELLLEKREIVELELAKVRSSLNIYRREIERAKEIIRVLAAAYFHDINIKLNKEDIKNQLKAALRAASMAQYAVLYRIGKIPMRIAADYTISTLHGPTKVGSELLIASQGASNLFLDAGDMEDIIRKLEQQDVAYILQEIGEQLDRELTKIGLIEAKLDEIKGRLRFCDTEDIRHKHVVQYLERLKERYPEKEATRLVNSFRIVQDIKNKYCNTNTKAKDVNKLFNLLKMYFTEREFLNEIVKIQRKINTELREDEKLDKRRVEEIKKFCERLIELWIWMFLW